MTKKDLENLVTEFVNEYCTTRDVDDELIAEYTDESLRNFINDSDMNTRDIIQLCEAVTDKNTFNKEYELEDFLYEEITFIEIED